MAEYWALHRIAARLGFKAPQSVGRAILKDGLPCIRRIKNGRRCWWIDDDLIRFWRLNQAKIDRDELLASGAYPGRSEERRKLKERAKQTLEAMQASRIAANSSEWEVVRDWENRCGDSEGNSQRTTNTRDCSTPDND